jgi:hypothetical protein
MLSEVGCDSGGARPSCSDNEVKHSQYRPLAARHQLGHPRQQRHLSLVAVYSRDSPFTNIVVKGNGKETNSRVNACAFHSARHWLYAWSEKLDRNKRHACESLGEGVSPNDLLSLSIASELDSRLALPHQAICVEQETDMKQLFHTAIYVNRASESLPKAVEGKDISDALTEYRPWTSGKKLFDDARESGCDLALIFAQFSQLDYWAIAEDITVREDNDGKKVTNYRFSSLQKIPGRARYRSDLTVLTTGEPLPDAFIRSYVLVKTPAFLKR